MRVASAQSKRPAYHRLIHPHLVQSMMYVCARIFPLSLSGLCGCPLG